MGGTLEPWTVLRSPSHHVSPADLPGGFLPTSQGSQEHWPLIVCTDLPETSLCVSSPPFFPCPPSLLLLPGITSQIKSVRPRPSLSSTFGDIKRQRYSRGMILHVGAALSKACLFHESMSSSGAPWVCFAHHRILNIVLTHSRCSINP